MFMSFRWLFIFNYAFIPYQNLLLIMSLEQKIQELGNISAAMGLLTKSGVNAFSPIKLAYQPYLIKRSHYQKIGQISRVWQKLLYLSSKDHQLIRKTFQEVIKVDELIQNVYKIYLKSSQLPKQDSLMFTRVDYFKDIHEEFKIIQYNLTAVSMHSHSENFLKAQKLHSLKEMREQETSYPHNTPCSDIADAVSIMYEQKSLKGIFLIIVSLHERNIIDQTNIQVKLLEKGIKSRRQCLCKLYSKLQKKGNKIYLHGEQISMVYYRAGYQPKDYCETGNLEQCWAVRQIIQLSDAIKIPDIKMQLMNQKRMQVELSKASVHSKYLTQEESQLLRQSLVFTIDFEQNTQQVDYLKFLQEKGVEKFILKPNLEGGGNNIYGKNVYTTLQSISEEERKKYIMMQKIFTNPTQNTIFMGETFKTLNCVCEISRYGVVMEIDGKLARNDIDGYLVRTKPETSDEGGVIAGYGAIAAMAFQD